MVSMHIASKLVDSACGMQDTQEPRPSAPTMQVRSHLFYCCECTSFQDCVLNTHSGFAFPLYNTTTSFMAVQLAPKLQGQLLLVYYASIDVTQCPFSYKVIVIH